jgi:Methyltransferase FkbM domain
MSQYQQQCSDERSSKQDIIKSLARFFQSPGDVPSETLNQPSLLAPCNYTFLDLGANVGDSLGKFIDSGIEPCPAKDLTENPRLDLDSIQFGETFHKKENRLVKSSRSILNQVLRSPKEYCYVGIEGNPRFTKRLKALQARINRARPRPIRNAQFMTETVAADSDGPTLLYLDTINEDNSFWGSSVLRNHQDVQTSAAGKVPQSADVEGITLTTLLKKTTRKVHGGHVIIKMDIEGGEYTFMEEAYRSGVLCNYAHAGVTIHIVMETHRPDVIGETNFDLSHWRHLKQSLKDCGVILQTGRDVGR